MPASVSTSVPVGEVERGERRLAAGRLAPARLPVQAPGDHQVEDQEELALEREHDALAEPAHAAHARPFDLASGGTPCAARTG